MHSPNNFEKDRELVQRVVQSDRDAMRELVERHQDHLYRLVYRLVGDGELAQDLTQETFLKVFERIDSLEDGRVFCQWLRQIATNLVRDRWRTRKETVLFEEDHPDLPQSNESPVRQAELREIERRVQAALLELPHEYREAFLLKYVEELPYQEMCTTLGIGISAAKVRVHRACKMLRELLPEYGLL